MKKHQLFIKKCKQEDGNAIIFVAMFIVVFCGFVALVVDGGSLFLEKSKLQKSLDASALAGAQDLLSSQGDAEVMAMEYGAKNGYSIAGAEVWTGDHFIQLDKTTNLSLTFAKVLGINTAEVSAMSRAELKGNLIKSNDVVPIGIEKSGFKRNESITLHFQPGNKNNEPQNGNFGYLDIEHPEYNTTRDKIKYGVTVEVSGDMYESTKTGMRWGQVDQGVQYRINLDSSKNHCQQYKTANSSCERVMILPVVKSYSEVSGKSNVKIVGFAAFWVESISQHDVRGRFIEMIASGEFGNKGNDFGVYGVRLVQ
ncbi:pilus assembly protein TadG-related protein [Halobacillus seohaensis]|uniref:Pilus assembly protein TadG-related protein n=1 Tax=Halobacillus seohaensis TaxID=447421 RepID=A0ABW2ENJ6_9BACI